MVGTLLVHAAAVGFLLGTVKPSKAAPPTYAVDLVAAPAPTQKRLAREALPTPPPEEKPSPFKPTPPKLTKAPAPPKPKTPPPPTEEKKEPPPKTTSPPPPSPGGPPNTGSHVAPITSPGLTS